MGTNVIKSHLISKWSGYMQREAGTWMDLNVLQGYFLEVAKGDSGMTIFK